MIRNIYIYLLILILTSGNAYASDSCNDDHISKIEAYINNINTLSAKFYRKDNERILAQGNLFINRSFTPKKKVKIKWHYTHPYNAEILIRNNHIAFYDRDLGSYDKILHSTLIYEVLGKQTLNLHKHFNVTNITSDNNNTVISISRKKLDKEAISLIFDKEIKTILGISVKITDHENATTVSLTDTQINQDIEPSVFTIIR